MKRRAIAVITVGILGLTPALTACDEGDREDIEDVGRDIQQEVDEEVDEMQDDDGKDGKGN
jgi:hypothetical protein